MIPIEKVEFGYQGGIVMKLNNYVKREGLLWIPL